MLHPQQTLGTQYACKILANQCPADQVVAYHMYDEAGNYLRGDNDFAGIVPGAGISATFVPQSRSGNLFQNGLDQRYNASVRGGTDQVRYYIGGTLQDQTGIVSYNTNTQKAMRANMTVLFGEHVNVDVSTGYSQGHTQYPTVAGEGGVWHQLVWSRGYQLPGVRTTTGYNFLGFQERFPTSYEKTDISRDYSHFTGSVTATHNFGGWFNQKLTFGLDRSSDTNNEYLPGEADFPNAPEGALTYGRPITQNITFDYGLSAKYQLTDAIGTTTSAGARYYYKSENSIQNYGAYFPSTSQTVIDQTEFGNRQVDYTAFENKELGFYVQEELSYQDRLFLTGALTGDDNSAFGANFSAQYYPKVSASWVVSDESFWNIGAINNFRLRGSWGQSGRQPSTFAAKTLYDIFIGPNGNGVVPSSIGNPDVGPEVSTELEVGADFSMLDDRLSAEFSWYNTTTKDLLLNQHLGPSTGLTGNRQTNLGELKSHGWEASLDAQIYNADNVAFDLNVSGDYFTNKISKLGIPGDAVYQEGWPYPALSTNYYLVSAEMNTAGTALQSGSEMCMSGVPAVAGGGNVLQGGTVIPCSSYNDVGILLGPTYPKYSFHVAPTLTLYRDIQVFALAEGMYGRWIHSTDANYACRYYRNCKANVVRDDPVFLAATSTRLDDRYNGGFPGDFWKLRQIGVRYNLPESVTSRIGADRASLSIAGYNLATLWQKTKTDLAGNNIYDPEYSVNRDNPSGTALWEMPGLASWNATLRVTF